PALDDPRRGPFLKWMFFAGSCLEPALMEKATGQKPEPTRSGWGDYERTEKVLAQGLKKGPWICGEAFTAADVIYGSSIEFLLQLKMLPERPGYQAYVARCVARPAYRSAREIESKSASTLDAAKAGR
ncbi:MAG: glutathione S-transferase, partial [Geminicoccales bacterium]